MLDTSIVATSIYSIAAEFNEFGAVNWVALAYTLTYLSFAVLFARVSDVVGRKAAFLTAFAIFIAFSLGCGFAQSLTQLIACRALQGLGGSGQFTYLYTLLYHDICCSPLPRALQYRHHHLPRDRKCQAETVHRWDNRHSHSGGWRPRPGPGRSPHTLRVMALGFLDQVSPSSHGPSPERLIVIASFAISIANWEGSGPIGSVSALVFCICWPDQSHMPNIERRRWKHLDYVGSLLLIAASVLICFAFQNGAIDPTQWGHAVFIAPLIVGVSSAFLLVAWSIFVERRWNGRLAAAIPMRLMRNRVYLCGVLNTMLLGFPYLLSVFTFPIRFQVVHGKSALVSGLMLLPMLAASASGSAAAGYINRDKNRLFETLILACLLMLTGCGLIMHNAKPSEAIESRVLGQLVLIGLGFGLSAAASTMLGVAEAPIREHAPAQGIIAQLRILGGSIGIAASSAILGRKTRDQLAGILTPEQLGGLAAQYSHLTPEQHAAVRATYTDALREDMIVCCAVLTAAVFFTLGVNQADRASVAERQRRHAVEERERLRQGNGPKEIALVDQAPAPGVRDGPANGVPPLLGSLAPAREGDAAAPGDAARV